MYNPEVPFGPEPFGPELKAEGLMAERKRRGHVLSNYKSSLIVMPDLIRHPEPFEFTRFWLPPE